MKSLILGIIFLFSASIADCQNAIPATGGEASSSQGSSSFTLGQVFYSTNIGTTVNLTQGVQQAFEFFTLSTTAPINISLKAITFPNPTVDFVILKITDSTYSYIPLQQTKANQVNITTFESPSYAGTFNIEKDEKPIEKVSYNYNRTESLLRYSNPKNWNNARVHAGIDELFSSIAKDNSIQSYWKSFAIFALLFLVLEMIILKFYK